MQEDPEFKASLRYIYIERPSQRKVRKGKEEGKAGRRERGETRKGGKEEGNISRIYFKHTFILNRILMNHALNTNESNIRKRFTQNSFYPTTAVFLYHKE
jgi:hypothetical protein